MHINQNVDIHASTADALLLNTKTKIPHPAKKVYFFSVYVIFCSNKASALRYLHTVLSAVCGNGACVAEGRGCQKSLGC